MSHSELPAASSAKTVPDAVTDGRAAKAKAGSPVRVTIANGRGSVTVELADTLHGVDPLKLLVSVLERARLLGRKALRAGLTVEAFAAAVSEMKKADDLARAAADSRAKCAAIFAPPA